jgi:hypothetical protein
MKSEMSSKKKKCPAASSGVFPVNIERQGARGK